MAARKILVIDDSRVIRNMVRDMLPPGNIEVLEAPDGIKGLEIIQNEHPWMILLDFLLPRMSGYEVYERLQQSRDLSCIPLLLMSGRKEEVTSKIPEPFEEKYFAFIEKPFEQKELLAGIKLSLELAKAKDRMLPVVSIASDVNVAAASVEVDAETLAKIAQLEEKLKSASALDDRLKALERNVATQTKQIGQLVAFIKQKFKG
ncbi:response regulator receiver protein [Thalassoporum mexicanum PCC 7367]|uniref:response regulator n=1 Tax=Thalassoporum mexicanum TaxID=3457544 RepID=UPI00029FECB0|nr:response regulator [Pseudanabaena sp. PCC 7367]AFY69092.1 response regulator receiver protein [Pseudanabaena sp. PCC 7367]